MATLYIDYENGNNNYGGTSFAPLASGTDGRISTSTFSSATASFPNDGSLINQYLSIFNGTIYAIYQITAYVSSTSLTIAAISGGTALANQAVDRQYYIGGRWQNISSGATAVRTIPGDTIRVMASPTPTSLGINGTWTSSGLPSTISISSSTNASPIAITTSSAHGYSTGDTVIILSHTTNTNANGTWTITSTGSTTFTLDGSTGNGVGGATGTVRKRTNSVVTLASALTQNIASFGQAGNGRTVWTQSTSVTATLLSTDTKEGNVSDSIAIADAFTTGKAAYKATGTLDLSGYQQISFWIKQTAGTVAVSGDISIRLCTDTIGSTSVHTCNIEGLSILNAWTPITIDVGTNLNSAIQSVALYVDTDRGAQTFLLSNIIACKASSSADSLTLQSLIGKNTTGETWWAIQSINGTRVFLDAYPSITPLAAGAVVNNRGYYGSTETVTTHKRETIKTPLAAASTTNVIAINEGGTSGSAIIAYEFGWDRTNMSSQNSETWLDGRNGNGNGISAPTTHVSFNKLSLIRYNYGINITSASATNITINKAISLSFNTTAGLFTNVTLSTGFNSNFYIDFIVGNLYGIQTNQCSISNIYNVKFISNVNAGIYFQYGAGYPALNILVDNCTFQNSGNYQLNAETMFSCRITNCNFYAPGTANVQLFSSMNNLFKSCTFDASGPPAATANIFFQNASSNNRFVDCTTTGSTSNALYIANANNNYGFNFTINETSEFSSGNNSAPFSNSRFYSHNHDNTSGNHLIRTDYGQIQSNTSVRNTASGLSWAMSPTSTIRASTYPLDFEIAKVTVAANSLVTVKAWMRRTNTALTTGLRIKGGQIAGVVNDITSYMTAAADTWEQITLTFTPTEIGVVEILAECYGGTTHTAYVDDISITQT